MTSTVRVNVYEQLFDLYGFVTLARLVQSPWVHILFGRCWRSNDPEPAHLLGTYCMRSIIYRCNCYLAELSDVFVKSKSNVNGRCIDKEIGTYVIIAFSL